jgi:AraC-like DNA-binding protein
MAALGVPTALVLKQANLPADLFATGDASLNAAQWRALWQAMQVCIEDPEFGLKAAQSLAGEPYDVLTMTALSARTFGEALVKVAKFKRLFAFEELTIGSGPGTSTLRIDSTLPETALPPLLVDMAFAHLVDLGRRGTGANLVPEAVRFRRRESHRGLYERSFGCRVEFDSAADEIVFDEGDVRRPFVTANALLNSYLVSGLEGELAPLTFEVQVAARLKARLAGQCPTAAQIASEMGVSTRTLRRRLLDEKTSFQEVLESVRRDLARTYLKESGLGLKQVAFLVGFEDVSSFQRAFRGWEGKPPGTWREGTLSSGPGRLG